MPVPAPGEQIRKLSTSVQINNAAATARCRRAGNCAASTKREATHCDSSQGPGYQRRRKEHGHVHPERREHVLWCHCHCCRPRPAASAQQQPPAPPAPPASAEPSLLPPVIDLQPAKKAGKSKRAAAAQGDDLSKEQQQQEALLDQLRTKVVVLQDQLPQLMPQMVRMEQVRVPGAVKGQAGPQAGRDRCAAAPAAC